MKKFIIALLVATAAAKSGNKRDGKDMARMNPDDMKGMEGMQGGPAGSLERMCWEWDTMECDMQGMRCARVEPDNWDFYSTKEG